MAQPYFFAVVFPIITLGDLNMSHSTTNHQHNNNKQETYYVHRCGREASVAAELVHIFVTFLKGLLPSPIITCNNVKSSFLWTWMHCIALNCRPNLVHHDVKTSCKADKMPRHTRGMIVKHISWNVTFTL